MIPRILIIAYIAFSLPVLLALIIIYIISSNKKFGYEIYYSGNNYIELLFPFYEFSLFMILPIIIITYRNKKYLNEMVFIKWTLITTFALNIFPIVYLLFNPVIVVKN